jgi:hypothetical protein
MPAWGATHDDDALWPVVAFMALLPQLSPDDYQALLAKAEGIGHHAADDGEKKSVKTPTHDHSTHKHGK